MTGTQTTLCPSRACIALLLCTLFPLPAAAQETTAPTEEPAPAASPEEREATPAAEPGFAQGHPLRLRPGVDAPLIGGLAVLDLTLWMSVSAQLPAAVVLPGALDRVSSFDSIALQAYRPDAARASDVLLYSLLAAPFLFQAIDDARWQRGNRWGEHYLTDIALTAEAFFLTMAVTDLIKYAVRRPRPLALMDPDALENSAARADLLEEQDEADAGLSFPSGHSSLSFALATASATLITLKHGNDHPGAVAVTWAVLLGAAGTTAGLRVAAGKHYPTDVIVGAALGAAIGVAVPLAHRPLSRLPFVVVPQVGARGGGVGFHLRL